MPLLSTSYTDLGTVQDKFGNDIVSFLYYPEEQLLYAQWKGNLTSEEVIKAAKVGLKYQQQYHFPLVLNDKTESTGDWSDAMPMLEYEWLPASMEEGLRAFAYVFSPDPTSHIISSEFVEKISKQLPIQLFYDVQSAWQWLRRQHKAA